MNAVSLRELQQVTVRNALQLCSQHAARVTRKEQKHAKSRCVLFHSSFTCIFDLSLASFALVYDGLFKAQFGALDVAVGGFQDISLAHIRYQSQERFGLSFLGKRFSEESLIKFFRCLEFGAVVYERNRKMKFPKISLLSVGTNPYLDISSVFDDAFVKASSARRLKAIRWMNQRRSRFRALSGDGVTSPNTLSRRRVRAMNLRSALMPVESEFKRNCYGEVVDGFVAVIAGWGFCYVMEVFVQRSVARAEQN
ncbi:uncharacterized protein EDB91DRAFT_1077731 [Suillus paluster]|uniref:uncharacterized protein n=1 Tax=Suillus paluster TaxID=48578 RepID=UPI001B85E6D9|nr:uncharacterized protein EDB91DRAFT_1077731 [Suillus paluster]KAG1752297.1 hypothetical protein EDB91DRAFT_1077731 [Suillus paluster]